MIYKSISKLPHHINFLKTRNEKKDVTEAGWGGEWIKLPRATIYLLKYFI